MAHDFHVLLVTSLFQSSKRTLRSNELMLPPSGLLDTELELHFSLQVSHPSACKQNHTCNKIYNTYTDKNICKITTNNNTIAK